MLPITPSRPNAYTGSPLDRAAHRRDDAAWIAAAEAGAGTLWAPLWRGRNLVRDAGDGHAALFLAGEAAGVLRAHGGAVAFLGMLEDRPVFATDIGTADEAVGEQLGGRFLDLRGIAGLLPAEDAAVLAHARGLMHWRLRHRFCGHCGTALDVRSAGNVLHCPGCAAQHFPRTDPAVIMLVVDGGRALLGHSERFPTPTMYSTLAGFVEPGESLEEAVAREVFEEVGVRVGRVLYHSSQPWPFPASLMLGFYAEAASEAITLDRDELTDARWFTRAEMQAPEAHGFSVPRADSIARRLIEDWIAA